MTEAEIRALARMIDRMDYYRVLRIDRNVPSTQVRQAYRRARREFHPDAFLGSEPNVRSAVDYISRRLTEAYLVLRDHQGRRSYDVGLETGRLRRAPQGAEDAADAKAIEGRTPNGKRFYRMALSEERSGNLAEAISHLQMALTFERDHDGFKAKLAELKERQHSG